MFLLPLSRPAGRLRLGAQILCPLCLNGTAATNSPHLNSINSPHLSCFLLSARCYPLSLFPLTLPAPSPPTHLPHPPKHAPARSREPRRRPRSPHQSSVFRLPSRSARDLLHRSHPPVPRSDIFPVPWPLPATLEETAAFPPSCDSVGPSG